MEQELALVIQRGVKRGQVFDLDLVLGFYRAIPHVLQAVTNVDQSGVECFLLDPVVVERKNTRRRRFSQQAVVLGNEGIANQCGLSNNPMNLHFACDASGLSAIPESIGVDADVNLVTGKVDRNTVVDASSDYQSAGLGVPVVSVVTRKLNTIYVVDVGDHVAVVTRIRKRDPFKGAMQEIESNRINTANGVHVPPAKVVR